MTSQATTTQAQIGTPAVPTNNRQLWITLALATVYLVWGTTYLAIRFALVSFPPYLLMGVRFVIAGSLLFVFARARRMPLPTWRQWRSSIIVGGLLLVGGMGGVAFAEGAVSSGLVRHDGCHRAVVDHALRAAGGAAVRAVSNGSACCSGSRVLRSSVWKAT